MFHRSGTYKRGTNVSLLFQQISVNIDILSIYVRVRALLQHEK